MALFSFAGICISVEEEYMNDVFEHIYSRRSVRDYKPDNVPDDIIRELIRAVPKIFS